MIEAVKFSSLGHIENYFVLVEWFGNCKIRH